MDKCRECYEKHLIDKFNCIADVEILELTLKIDNPAQDYKHPEIHEGWVDWKKAWNVSHDRCVELCKEVVDEYNGDNSSLCITFIKNDKVKL